MVLTLLLERMDIETNTHVQLVCGGEMGGQCQDFCFFFTKKNHVCISTHAHAALSRTQGTAEDSCTLWTRKEQRLGACGNRVVRESCVSTIRTGITKAAAVQDADEAML